jgi:hypothetical protein
MDLKLTPASSVDCETCQAHLADYVRMELSGQAAEQTYPEIAFHIETCERCEAAYYREFRSQGQRKSLTELQQIGQRSQVAEVMRQILATPTPDLMPAPDPSWYEVALDYGRAWLEQETGRWRQLWLSLATLGRGQALAPVLVGLMGDVAVSPSPAQGILNIAPADANFEIKLTVTPEPTVADEDLCRVDVALTLKDRFGDFSGAQIILFWGDTAHMQETDALGKVSFRGLPCDQVVSMSLTVTLPGHSSSPSSLSDQDVG